MEAAGSIVGLLAIGYKIYKSLDEFVSSCKDAPTIAIETRDQVQVFRYSLQKLAPYIRERAEITSLGRSNTDINQLKITLASSVDTFSQTQRLLDRLSPRKQEKMDYLGRIRWARAEGDLSKLLSRIEKHQTTLILLLAIWTSESSAQTENNVDRLNDLLTSIMAPGGAPETTPLPFNPSTDALSLNDHGGHIFTEDMQGDLADDDSVSILSATRSLGERSRRNFESMLRKSRAYRNPAIFADSRFSVSPSQRHTHWSLFSGGSNTSVLSLCYTGFENSGRTLASESDLGQIPLPLYIGSLHNQFWYPPSAGWIESDLRYSSPDLKPFLSVRPYPTKVTGSMADQIRPTARSSVGLEFMVEELYHSSGSCERFAVSYGRHIGNACLEGDLHKMEILFGWEAEMMRVYPEWKHKGHEIGYKWETAEGESILALAIKNSDSAMVEMILNRAAGVNRPFADMPMALQLAIETNSAAIVQLLLGRGADIHRCSQSTAATLLIMAVQAKNGAMVEMILDRGVDVNHPSVHGSTALPAAIETKDLEIVQILLDRGADVNRCSHYTSTMPLVVAVQGQNEAMVKMILDGGADINHCLLYGQTALQVAIGSGNLAIVRVLLDRGADVNPRSQFTSATPLVLAVKAKNEAMVEMILDRGADINSRLGLGPTALEMAISTNHVAILQTLLNRGADIYAKTSNGYVTVLDMAAKCGQPAIYPLVLERSLKVEGAADISEMTSLAKVCAV